MNKNVFYIKEEPQDFEFKDVQQIHEFDIKAETIDTDYLQYPNVKTCSPRNLQLSNATEYELSPDVKEEEEEEYGFVNTINADQLQQPLLDPLDVTNKDVFVTNPEYASKPPFNCNKYRRQYKSHLSLKLHSEYQNCSPAAPPPSMMTTRVDNHHKANKQKIFKCSGCNAKSFRAAGGLTMHARYCDGMKSKCCCKICKIFLPNIAALEHHCLRLHPHQNQFKCSNCNLHFQNLDHLVKHERSCKGLKVKVTRPQKLIAKETNRSPVQGIEQVQQQALTIKSEVKVPVNKGCRPLPMAKEQLKAYYGGMQSMYCKICCEQFISIETLEKHRKKHIMSNAYACHLCKEKFDNHDDAKSHLNHVHQ